MRSSTNSLSDPGLRFYCREHGAFDLDCLEDSDGGISAGTGRESSVHSIRSQASTTYHQLFILTDCYHGRDLPPGSVGFLRGRNLLVNYPNPDTGHVVFVPKTIP